MMKYLLIVILCTSTLLACTQKKEVLSQQKDDDQASVSNSEQNRIEIKKNEIATDSTIESKGNKIFDEEKPVGVSKKFKFNNEHYLLEEGNIILANSKIFNLTMQERGRVKGTMVIVTTDIELTAQHFSLDKKSIKEIAGNTFRLYPRENADLYQMYKKLEKLDIIERVEIEVDYSGKTAPAEY